MLWLFKLLPKINWILFLEQFEGLGILHDIIQHGVFICSEQEQWEIETQVYFGLIGWQNQLNESELA